MVADQGERETDLGEQVRGAFRRDREKSLVDRLGPLLARERAERRSVHPIWKAGRGQLYIGITGRRNPFLRGGREFILVRGEGHLSVTRSRRKEVKPKYSPSWRERAAQGCCSRSGYCVQRKSGNRRLEDQLTLVESRRDVGSGGPGDLGKDVEHLVAVDIDEVVACVSGPERMSGRDLLLPEDWVPGVTHPATWCSLRDRHAGLVGGHSLP